MANIKDVAKLANVGIATVSRVTNNTGYVSEKTRTKVLSAMEELSFLPNAMGRSLKTQKSMIIGLVVPDIAQIIFARLAYYISLELEKFGYILAACNSHGNSEKEIEFINLLRCNRFDGLIMISDNDLSGSIEEIDMLVTVDAKLGENIPCVYVDNAKGGILATSLLISGGSKKLGYIGPKLAIQSKVDCRWHSFCTICEGMDIPYVCELYEYSHGDEMQVAKNFLEKNPDLDGIFAASDDLAYCLLDILQNNGKNVPKDVQLVGFDGVFIDSHLPIRQISTITYDLSLLGELLANTIVKKINGESLDEIQTVLVNLFKGSSTR